MDRPIAWYDPSNGVVSTDKDCPLFTPLGQVWALYPEPKQEQWLQAVTIKIEAALLSHRLSLHNDVDDDGVGFPLVDALCCGQTSLDIGKREVEDIAEAIYHVLDANAPPAPAAQPKQEPVAWMHEWEDGERIPLMYSSDSGDNDEPVSVRPLVYGDTTPPQRPWVGLSDSQIEQVYYDAAKLHRGAPMPWGQVQFGNALQALVKEKNYD